MNSLIVTLSSDKLDIKMNFVDIFGDDLLCLIYQQLCQFQGTHARNLMNLMQETPFYFKLKFLVEKLKELR